VHDFKYKNIVTAIRAEAWAVTECSKDIEKALSLNRPELLDGAAEDLLEIAQNLCKNIKKLLADI